MNKLKNQIKNFNKQINLELIFWIGGLLFLAFNNPENGSHISICILKNLGINFCPGCGLGRSISYIFNGEILKSVQTHPLGIPALIILSTRIFNLTKLIRKQTL